MNFHTKSQNSKSSLQVNPAGMQHIRRHDARPRFFSSPRSAWFGRLTILRKIEGRRPRRTDSVSEKRSAFNIIFFSFVIFVTFVVKVRFFFGCGSSALGPSWWHTPDNVPTA
jgi:hypothetical protein